MDFEWKFHLGDVYSDDSKSHSASYTSCKAGAIQGAGGKYWNDTEWRTVDLPHDYCVEGGFSEDELLSHGYKERKNAWYRKTFLLDEALEDKEIYVCFEGTAVNAEFYFNGSLMARSFSAYNETLINITDRAYFGDKANTLAVYINGSPIEGWWYEGAGIYRHVRLYAKDKVHIAHNGIFGKPVLREGSKNDWSLNIETTVENSHYTHIDAVMRVALLDGENVICENIGCIGRCEGDSSLTVCRSLPVYDPIRWDIDSPKLYTLQVELLKNGKVVDEDSVRIGFRTIHADPDRGFFLNERPIKIKGTCNHQDHAGVGVAVPDSIHHYRIQRLKELGSNAYRCAHNPPAKELLDACDELGMLVMDETRHFESSDEQLAQLEIMVRRDRNHPSVIMWSLLNEEPLQDTEEGAKIFRRMKSLVNKLDDSRFVTGGHSGVLMGGTESQMDMVGINYHLTQSQEMHKRYPTLSFFGSETNSATSTRGCYKTDMEKHILNNYDEEVVAWGQSVRDAWDFVRTNDYFAGLFIWTGFDYRGEPTPFGWPSVSSQFGIMDTCGFAKDSFYFNKACFTDESMVHLLPHWNWNEGETVRVMAVSNCEEVELFLNGRSLGKKKSDICTNTPEWNVKFEAGTLSARAYRNGVCVATAEQKTAGEPYAIRLSLNTDTIKNDGHDTVIVNACVVDKNGVAVPTADNLLHFEIVGDGFVRGVGNGDPNSHEAEVLPERRLYNGLCQALISSMLGAENISVRVWGEGLKEVTVNLKVQKVEPPRCPATAKFRDIEDFFMSEITEKKPDALISLDDNDMNSFVPLKVKQGMPQPDFCHGWRIYKTTVDIYSDGEYMLMFRQIRCNKAEIYVNGALIDTIDEYTKASFDTATFKASSGQRLDIRILLYVQKESTQRGAGIEAKVILQEKKKSV